MNQFLMSVDLVMMLCYMFGLGLVVACGPFLQLSFALVLLAVN